MKGKQWKQGITNDVRNGRIHLTQVIIVKGGKTLNKTDLVNKVAQRTGAKKKDVDMIISTMLESIGDALVSGDKVQLVGFGSFEVRNRAERIGRNPRTKEEILIPACKVPAFRAGKTLKDKVSGS